MIHDLIEAAKAGDTETINLLLDKEPNLLQARAENGESPLIGALYYGKTSAVELLLQRGVLLNIHEAAAIGDDDYVDYLLEEDASLMSAYSFDGWTPLHLAAFFGGYDVADYLIKRGADVNAVSSNPLKNTPIHVATAGRKFDLVKLLLEHGADPNLPQSGGWTPLHQAVQNWDHEMVKLLLSYKADPNRQRDDGSTPISIAEDKQFDDILQLLTDKRP